MSSASQEVVASWRSGHDSARISFQMTCRAGLPMVQRVFQSSWSRRRNYSTSSTCSTESAGDRGTGFRRLGHGLWTVEHCSGVREGGWVSLRSVPYRQQRMGAIMYPVTLNLKQGVDACTCTSTCTTLHGLLYMYVRDSCG